MYSLVFFFLYKSFDKTEYTYIRSVSKNIIILLPLRTHLNCNLAYFSRSIFILQLYLVHASFKIYVASSTEIDVTFYCKQSVLNLAGIQI